MGSKSSQNAAQAAAAMRRFQEQMRRPESDRTFVMTEEWMRNSGTSGCGWTRVQMAILGIHYPAHSGWLRDVIGMRITEQTAAEFCGKNAKRKKLKSVKPQRQKANPKMSKSTGESVTCPYCGRHAEWVSNETVYGRRYGKSYMLWLCRPCDARVGCHENTMRPLGTMANAELRKWRMKAHDAIDPLYKSGRMTRGELYQKLSIALGKEVHVGESDIEQCQFVIAIANDMSHPERPEGQLPKGSIGRFDCSPQFNPESEWPDEQMWDGISPPWVDQDDGSLTEEFREIVR